jgi:hypothetical protein
MKRRKKDKGYCIGEDDEDDEGEDYNLDCDWDNKQARIHCCGEVTLFLLRNPVGIRDLLAMEIDVKHNK